MTDQDETGYRMLADHVISLTNPPDEDAAEVWICMQAVSRLVDYVKDERCCCPVPEMDEDHGAWEACKRCFVLGRFNDREVSR